jgi:hypothetical protein
MLKPEEWCKHTANAALTTDYVFRSPQTAEGPAVQGGFDVTCGISTRVCGAEPQLG